MLYERRLKGFLHDQNVITSNFVRNFIKDRKLQELYPNVWILLRILLPVSVMVASGERNLSKLDKNPSVIHNI